MTAIGGFFKFHKRLPLVLQAEAAECGLACIAMIANYYGHAVDLPALRRRFSTSARGVSLSRIISNADSLGFDSRPLRVELEYLPQLQIPCILHWNLNHFVVLKRATAKRIEIHDPASGLRSLSMEEASKHITGIALELQPKTNFQPIEEQKRVSLRALTGDLHGVKSAAIQVLLLALCLEMFGLIMPLYMQTVLDQAIVTTDTRLLHLLGLGFLFIVIFHAGMNAARGWAITWIGGKLNAQWASNLFSHMLGLPMGYFEKRSLGDITTRFASVQLIQQTLTGSFVAAILDGMMGTVTLAILLLYSFPLTCLISLGLGIYGLCRWLAYRLLWQMSEEQLIYSARQKTSMYESIRGVQTIKLANKQADRAARFATVTLQSTQRTVTLQRIGVAFASINQGLFGVLSVAMVWIAAIQVLKGNFSIGMLVAFVAYADRLTTRFGGLIDKIVELRMLLLHANRIADIALSEPEMLGQSRLTSVDVRADIEVDNVSFRYSESDPWVLRNCSFRVEEGQSVAVTGPSGCGKTTLVKLILGLLEPIDGTIRIGGIPIKQYGIGAYRDLIGTVMQHDELFEGTVGDNICFFDEMATPDKIEVAATQAAIHDEIISMPMGYDTHVGDMGSSLSGGQKQRILLARAFYRKPKVLLFDEATNNLDVERERAINATIRNMKVTRIIIAHRPETIASADFSLTIVSGAIDKTISLHPV